MGDRQQDVFVSESSFNYLLYLSNSNLTFLLLSHEDTTCAEKTTQLNLTFDVVILTTSLLLFFHQSTLSYFYTKIIDFIKDVPALKIQRKEINLKDIL